MHNPESILENETHRILRGFEIQTHHLISARRPDLGIVKKKVNLLNSALSRPTRSQKTVKRGMNIWTLLEKGDGDANYN